MISFGILLRKLEFSVAEFGIFTLRKSGISFCGFWKKHLPFLDFQFAIIGKLTCGKHYTSKASFLDDDVLPVYGENDEEQKFSGRRISRGLYRTKNGTILNADINGSANILRKASPNAFEGITDYRFLQKVKTVPFRALYPSGTVSV